MTIFSFTLYPSVKSHENHEVFAGTMAEFAKRIETRPILGIERNDKEKAPVFYPALFSQSNDGLYHHNKDSVSEITAITLDIETSKKIGEIPCSVEEVTTILEREFEGTAFLLYTTQSHTPDYPRWRLIVPFASPIKLTVVDPSADLATQKLQQYERSIQFAVEQRIRLRLAKKLGISLDTVDHTKLNAYGASFVPSAAREEDLIFHRLIVSDGVGLDATKRWHELWTEEKEKQKQASLAASSPSGLFTNIALGPGSEGLIAELVPFLPSLAAILIDHGYERINDRYLAPGSSSGLAGVVILDGPNGRERLYSHHGPDSDPLSAAGNQGHALDALDALTILDYGGNRRLALSNLANQHGINRADRVIKAASQSADGNWPEPEPLSFVRGTADRAAPYPIDVLPPIVRNAVLEVAQATQAPLAMIAVSALSAASAALQGHINIQRKKGLVGPISLYSLTIAMSGERKSTVDRLFASEISQWCSDQIEELKPQLARYAAEIEAHNSIKKALSANILKAGKKGDHEAVERFTAELSRHEAKAPKPVTIPDMLLEDMTAEALVDRLQKFPSKYLRTAEGGNLFGGYSMHAERSTYTLSILNKGWDGDPINLQRKISSSANVQTPRLTTNIMVQPQTLHNFLREQGNNARGIGFLARFLLCEPISTQGTRFDKDTPEPVQLKAFNKQIRKFLDQPLPFENGVLRPGTIILEGAARKAWGAIHDEFEAGLKPGGPYFGFNDLASKAAEQVARLAAIFACMQYGLGTHPDEHDVLNAAVIVQWHMNEAMRIFSRVEADAALTDAVDLSRWLIEQSKARGCLRLSRREIQRSGPSSVRSKEALQKALLELIEAGHVREVQLGRQKVIEINPLLLSHKN